MWSVLSWMRGINFKQKWHIVKLTIHGHSLKASASCPIRVNSSLLKLLRVRALVDPTSRRLCPLYRRWSVCSAWFLPLCPSQRACWTHKRGFGRSSESLVHHLLNQVGCPVRFWRVHWTAQRQQLVDTYHCWLATHRRHYLTHSPVGAKHSMTWMFSSHMGREPHSKEPKSVTALDLFTFFRADLIQSEARWKLKTRLLIG